MFTAEIIETHDRKEFYRQLNMYLVQLIEEEPDWLASLCNAASLLYLLIQDINWAGFYLYKEGQLILGPFQGKPACTRIAWDVCMRNGRKHGRSNSRGCGPVSAILPAMPHPGRKSLYQLLRRKAYRGSGY